MWTLPEKYANFAVDSTVNEMAPKSTKSADIAGAANINILNNEADISIGKNAAVTALGKAANIQTNTHQATVVMNGKPNIGINPNVIPNTIEALIYGGDKDKSRLKTIGDNWKQILMVQANTSAPNAIGGVVGVAQHSTTSNISVGEGAAITGRDATILDKDGKPTADTYSGVNIHGENNNYTTDLSYGAGHSANIGFEGLFSWLGGKSTNTISVDRATLRSFAEGDLAGHTYGNVSVDTHTNNVLTNLVGALAWGSGAASVGASVGVLYEDVDNTVSVKDTTIDAASVDMNALTDGVMNNLAIAGSFTDESQKSDEKKSEKPADQLKKDTTDPIEKTSVEKIETAESTADEKTKEVKEEAGGKADSTQSPSLGDDPKNAKPTDKGIVSDAVNLTQNKKQNSTGASGVDAAAKKNQQASKVQVAASGSAAINVVTSKTQAEVSGGTINIHPEAGGTDDFGSDGHMGSKAEDASYSGAYSGAAAINWQQGAYAQKTKKLKDTVIDKKSGGMGEKTEVTTPEAPAVQQTAVNAEDGTQKLDSGKNARAAIAGAAAINVTTQDVTSTIDGVTINHAGSITNIAQRDGAAVAAGLGLAASVTKQATAAADLAAAFSFNEVNNNVNASIQNSTIKSSDGTDLKNIAYDSDTQVAGGLNASFAKGGKYNVAIGGTVAINDAHNDIKAIIDGADIEAGRGSVMNHAAEKLTQVGAALGFTATTGQGTGVMVSGVLASNNAENTIHATIGSDTAKTTIIAGNVDNMAYDAGDLSKSFDQDLENNSINVTGSTYLGDVTDNAATNGRSLSETHDMTDRDYDIKASNKEATKQMGAAIAISLSEGEKGVGATGAASISTLRNDISAHVKNTTIISPIVSSGALSDALMVDVACGTSLTNGMLSGAGSISAQYTSNKTTATIDDSIIKTSDLNVSAKSNNLDVNVAGQIGYGKNGVGFAIAFNHLGSIPGILKLMRAAIYMQKISMLQVWSCLMQKEGLTLAKILRRRKAYR